MNPEVQASVFDIAHLWAQGDAVQPRSGDHPS